jgi:uncharacterized membrane protein YgdD (TMEM256/DUF423 family)
VILSLHTVLHIFEEAYRPIGAYGAHGLKGISNEFKDIWKTASLYHLVHTCALAGAATSLQGRKQLLCCGFFLLGIILFSGSCYTVALKQNRKFGIAAPYGGISFMIGWLAFAFL